MYGIRVTRQYFGPREETWWLADDHGDPMIYRTRKAASKKAAELTACWVVYPILMHNESSGPTYRVARYCGIVIKSMVQASR